MLLAKKSAHSAVLSDVYEDIATCIYLPRHHDARHTSHQSIPNMLAPHLSRTSFIEITSLRLPTRAHPSERDCYLCTSVVCGSVMQCQHQSDRTASHPSFPDALCDWLAQRPSLRPERSASQCTAVLDYMITVG